MTPPAATPAPRTASVERRTKETDIRVALTLDGTGTAEISTGVGFLDHLLDALAKHARFDLALACRGDLHIDDHHTAEDCAIVLGQALDQALGDRAGISRFADAHAPLDEALARVVVDLVARPHATVSLGLTKTKIGDLSTEMVPHVLASFATAGRFTLHADVLRGDNDHHKAEAAFKALALALRVAVARTGEAGPPSTRGAM